MKGSFVAEESELEAVGGSLREGMGLGGNDSVAVVSCGSGKPFLAQFPSGQLWALQLAGISREKAERLLLSQGPGIDSTSKETYPGYPASLNIRNPLLMYRITLKHLLLGNTDLCRSFLHLIPAGSGFNGEVANIQSLIEIESGENNVTTARDILRKALLQHPATQPMGKIIRYNLASLQQEAGELQDAEDILLEIFSQDWHFLDVRERLRSFSREEIALAKCRRSLQALAHIVFSYREITGILPDSLHQLVPQHLSVIPQCPLSLNPYAYSQKEGEFSLFCPGNHHRECGLKENEPSFHSSSLSPTEVQASTGENWSELPPSRQEDHGNEGQALEDADDHGSQQMNARLPVEAINEAIGYSMGYCFRDLMAATFMEYDRERRPFALLLIVIDQLDEYESAMGSAACTRVLKEIAGLLKSYSCERDVVCRYGAEAFAVIIKDSEKGHSIRIAERIREAFHYRFHYYQVKLTVSIGVASVPTDAVNKSIYVKAAEAAFSRSWKNGGNQVSYAPSLE